MQLLIGSFLGILIALLAWRLRALDASGAAAAAVTGGLIFGLGGLGWAVLLMVFFVSSSALSRAFEYRKKNLNEKFSKGSQRDWGQVLANGGIGALMVVIHFLLPEQAWPWLAFAGSMAAVNADTWATELGVLNPTRPRLISNWKIVERGTSGGVSWLGTLAAFSGAALIGLCALIFTPASQALALLAIVSFSGLFGSLFDSFLGATVQAIYYCPRCQKETERHPLHSCGTETMQIRGWRWLNNDWVNIGCALFGALAAGGLWGLLH